MTQLFRAMRLYGHGKHQSSSQGIYSATRRLIIPPVALLLLTATVLGIAAYWASIFLPNIRRAYCCNLTISRRSCRLLSDDFSIFSLIVPALTIVLLLVGYVAAQMSHGDDLSPRTRADYNGRPLGQRRSSSSCSGYFGSVCQSNFPVC